MSWSRSRWKNTRSRSKTDRLCNTDCGKSSRISHYFAQRGSVQVTRKQELKATYGTRKRGKENFGNRKKIVHIGTWRQNKGTRARGTWRHIRNTCLYLVIVIPFILGGGLPSLRKRGEPCPRHRSYGATTPPSGRLTATLQLGSCS